MATAPGVAERKRLMEAGFSADQVVEWEQTRRTKLATAGFSDEQINEYFGTGRLNDEAILRLRDREFTEQTLATGETQPAMVDAKGFIQSLAAGWQGSVGGLTKRQKLPDVYLPEDANFIEVMGSAIGQFAGDLPVSIPTFLAGFGIGGSTGGAAGGAVTRTPQGAAVGATVGGFAGGEGVSGFVTEGARQSLINFYRINENMGRPANVREYTSRLIAGIMDPSTLKQAGKGGAVGVATGVVGGGSRLALAPIIRNTPVRQLVIAGAEVTTAVTAAAALEGEMPDAKDFASAAAIVMTLELGGSIVGSARASKEVMTQQDRIQELFQDHYITTGERPEQALERFRLDPVFRQQIVGDQRAEGTVTIKVGRDADDVTGLPDTGRAEPVIIDKVRDGEAAVEGAREAMDRLGDNPHSAIFGAASPSIPKMPKKAPLDPADPLAVARSETRAKIKDTKVRPTVKQTIDRLRYDFVNELQYVVSAAEEVYKTTTFDPETGRGMTLEIHKNPGELMRLAYGAHAQAELAIRKGVYTKSGKKVFPALNEILEGVDDMDFFVEYMISKRVLEKHEQGLETGFDLVNADLIVKQAERDTDFAKRFDQVQTWQNTQLLELRDAGLLSEEDIGKIMAQNQSYVPFMRVLQDGNAPPGASARGLPVRKPTKKFEGSAKDIFDPLEVMLKNRYALQQIAENNRARQRLVEWNAQLPEEMKIIHPAKKRTTVTKIAETDTQIMRFLEENGIDPSEATGLHVYRAMNKNLGRGDFIVFEDGKPMIYTADDPNLVLSMQRLDVQTQNAIIKMLSVPSAMLRGGVTLDPSFSLKASLRDQLGAILMNDFTVVPFLDLFRGFSRLLPSGFSKEYDPVVTSWIQNGGANSSLLSIDQAVLSDALSDRPQTYRERAWNVVLFPLRKAAAFSQLMENAMRVGRYERALDEGLSMQEAALQSRDVTLDFGRMGARVRAYNLITTWIGAGINGIDRFHQAFRKNPAGTMMKTAGMITLPSMILYFANRDEEWYQDLPEWEKMLFWHFPVGKAADGGPKYVLRIPMPHQYGTIFGYLPTKMFEEFEKAEPEPGKAIREAIMTTYNLPLFPTIATPVSEVAFNYSFFTGEPIVSRAQERILPEYQYGPQTTEVARKIGKILATVPGGIVAERFTSPIAIEHMVRGYSGTIGMKILRELDTGLKNIGALENYDRPDPNMSDDIIYGSFFTRHNLARQSITDFYDNADDMERIMATLRQEAFRQNPQEIERILRRRGFPALKPGKVKEALGNMRKAQYAIHFDKTMEGSEKRQLIDELSKQQVAIAREFNRQVEEFRKREKERKKQEKKDKQ